MNKRASWIYPFMLSVLLLIFVFQPFLEYIISPLKFWDEFYAFCLVPLLIWHLTKNRMHLHISAAGNVLIIILILFSLVGMISTLKYHYQPMNAVFRDWFLHMKFFMAIGTTWILFQEADMDYSYWYIWTLVRTLVSVLFFTVVLDYAFHIFPATMRMGLRAEAIFYGHPTSLAAAGFFLTALLLRLYEYRGKRIVPYLGMIWLVIISTLRAKAVGGVLFSIFVFLIIIRRQRRFGLTTWFGLGIGLLALGARQLSFYYSSASVKEVRHILTVTAQNIARDRFPFGTGFATFASAYSGNPYSKVYYLYHLNRVWGLTPEKPSFISDTFWPMILGQTGYLGLIIYMLVLLTMFVMVIKVRKVNAYSYGSMLSALVYLVISSTSESSFVNPMAVPLAMILGLSLLDQQRRNR